MFFGNNLEDVHEWPNINIYTNITCNLVLITSAGVTRDAAGAPAIAPATSNVHGALYPFSSANFGLT